MRVFVACRCSAPDGVPHSLALGPLDAPAAPFHVAWPAQWGVASRHPSRWGFPNANARPAAPGANARSAPRFARCGCACGAARGDARRTSSPCRLRCLPSPPEPVAFREPLPPRAEVPSTATLGSPTGPRCARLRPTRTLFPPRCAVATEVHRDRLRRRRQKEAQNQTRQTKFTFRSRSRR